MTATVPINRRPIYDAVRRFLGRRDLVVSFYTAKCQFQCAYCALPLRSANERVEMADLNAQIDHVFDKYAAEALTLQQLSFGNEGSALDRARFHPPSLDHLLDRAQALRGLEVLSIETRPEYVSCEALTRVISRTHAPKVDVTVGFETQDDALRTGLLNKNISRRIMEDRVRLLGELGVRLTSYVMVKPAPGMTEAEGVAEAVATLEYLRELTALHEVDLVVYLTPTYIAEGSLFATAGYRQDYVPPSIQSILQVVQAGHVLGLPVYTGLWSEGLADDGGDFRSRAGYDPAVREALLALNRSGDPRVLERLADLARA